MHYVLHTYISNIILYTYIHIYLNTYRLSYCTLHSTYKTVKTNKKKPLQLCNISFICNICLEFLFKFNQKILEHEFSCYLFVHALTVGLKERKFQSSACPVHMAELTVNLTLKLCPLSPVMI